jgi:hypothetical protein
VNHPLRLFELLAGPDHTLLLYADDPAQLPMFAEIEKLAATLTGGRARTYVITATPDLRVAGLPVIVDAAGEFRTAYAATGGSGYLVRPDGYLGFRAAPLTATALRSHLERVFATRTPADVVTS